MKIVLHPKNLSFGDAGVNSNCEQILRLPLVIALTGLSKSSIYAAMIQNRFPMSVAIGVRAVGWKRKDITNWLESRKPSNLKEAA
ncbi:helix-turn-helix transcriptional regulator [Undibacterium flavidum]|uniref:AlpA family phage regulatory protein n=1 Tax=Undibacterium flavidum TaxID=2762297 RepID=A0ABR6YDH6_9BURK|nr:AlpA family phage regulatory protein [Undibacterium flavidum]MBC3874604.1 AlpA family phage regulatory protein [Undibacterium flavidum]